MDLPALPSLRKPSQKDKDRMDNCPFSGWIKLLLILNLGNLGISITDYFNISNLGSASGILTISSMGILFLYIIIKK